MSSYSKVEFQSGTLFRCLDELAEKELNSIALKDILLEDILPHVYVNLVFLLKIAPVAYALEFFRSFALKPLCLGLMYHGRDRDRLDRPCKFSEHSRRGGFFATRRVIFARRVQTTVARRLGY